MIGHLYSRTKTAWRKFQNIITKSKTVGPIQFLYSSKWTLFKALIKPMQMTVVDSRCPGIKAGYKTWYSQAGMNSWAEHAERQLIEGESRRIIQRALKYCAKASEIAAPPSRLVPLLSPCYYSTLTSSEHSIITQHCLLHHPQHEQSNLNSRPASIHFPLWQ